MTWIGCVSVVNQIIPSAYNARNSGKQFLLNNKNETITAAPAERKVPSLSFSALLRKQLPELLY
jgi:hypothetical protein